MAPPQPSHLCIYMHSKLFWAQPSTEAIQIDPSDYFSD